MNDETVLSNFTLGKDDIISERLNVILQNFAANDAYVYGQFDKIPGVWKCLWYNDDRISGYNKKDFFWLNTENRSRFFKNNAEQMRRMVDINPVITEKLPPWKNNDQTVFDKYNNVLTGYFDSSMSTPFLPWAEIGTLSACTQLVVSQEDNNKHKISDKTKWKRFLVEDDDVDDITRQTQDVVDKAISTHEMEYHFGESISAGPAAIREEITNLSNSLESYVDANFGNISASYPENYLANDFECNGFDVVELFVEKPIPDKTLSGYVIERQWFRLWRSGFLEHGGLLKTTNCLNETRTMIEIDLDWELSSSYSKFYDIKYLGDKTPNGDEMLVDDSSSESAGGLLSVLYELDPSFFENQDELGSLRDHAPAFQSNDYSLNLTPVYPTNGLSAMPETVPYSGLGNHATEKNVVAGEVELKYITKNKIRIPYDSKTAPVFFSYYAAGFCLPQND